MLLPYLKRTFFEEAQLLELSGFSAEQLCEYQQHDKMPKASYIINQSLECSSFFGEHKEFVEHQYYAKRYVFWLTWLKDPDFEPHAYFEHHYLTTLKSLENKLGKIDGFYEKIDQHLASEWQHFLEGTYGLCTVTGLPEDIAKKEYAILKIKTITEDFNRSELSQVEKKTLLQAVNLMDQVTSAFAPHERERSSRQKYIVELMDKFQLHKLN